jgi:hypothetical protein
LPPLTHVRLPGTGLPDAALRAVGLPFQTTSGPTLREGSPLQNAPWPIRPTAEARPGPIAPSTGAPVKLDDEQGVDIKTVALARQGS